MRATLIIPDRLMEEVRRISGEKSKTRAIVAAMESYVLRSRVEDLLALRGKLPLSYDWAAAEEDELRAAEKREGYRAGRRPAP